MKQTYLECGKIINIHGFRGTVKLESYCDSPEVLASLSTLYLKSGTEYVAKKVLHASVFKQFVLCDLQGVTDENAANQLRNQTVYAFREDLPIQKGSYFLADLIGLPVLHADTNEKLGELIAVDSRGNCDLFTVKTPHGEELMPSVPEFVIRIDPENAIYVRPIPGLLDGGAQQV